MIDKRLTMQSQEPHRCVNKSTNTPNKYIDNGTRKRLSLRGICFEMISFEKKIEENRQSQPLVRGFGL